MAKKKQFAGKKTKLASLPLTQALTSQAEGGATSSPPRPPLSLLASEPLTWDEVSAGRGGPLAAAFLFLVQELADIRLAMQSSPRPRWARSSDLPARPGTPASRNHAGPAPGPGKPSGPAEPVFSFIVAPSLTLSRSPRQRLGVAPRISPVKPRCRQTSNNPTCKGGVANCPYRGGDQIARITYDGHSVLGGFLPPNEREPAFITSAFLRKADGGEGERRARGGLVTPGPQNEIG